MNWNTDYYIKNTIINNNNDDDDQKNNITSFTINYKNFNLWNTIPTTISSLASSSISLESSSPLLPSNIITSSTLLLSQDYTNIGDNQTFLEEECSIDLDNVTNQMFPGEFPKPKELGLNEYLKITLYVLAILASLFGNSAVVICVLLKRSLRVTVNLYLANLAVADILICICCMWVHLVNHLSAPAFVLGPFLCKMNSFVQMTCLTSSVLTLSAIACDRYMAIMYPLRTRVTKQRTGIVITVIWIISMIISLPFYLMKRYKKIEWQNYTEITCVEDWPHTMFYSVEHGCDKSETLKAFYYTLVAITLFFAPVLIMITAYSAIIWILWGSKLPGEANESNLRHQKKSKRKVIKMVVVVLLVFVICWLPLQIIILCSVYFDSMFGPNLVFYSHFVAYLNSAFNPIIYGGFNKNFRDAILKNAFCQSVLCCFDSGRWQQPQISVGSMSTIVTTITNRNGANSGSVYRTSVIRKTQQQLSAPATPSTYSPRTPPSTLSTSTNSSNHSGKTSHHNTNNNSNKNQSIIQSAAHHHHHHHHHYHHSRKNPNKTEIYELETIN